jgi:hypothetical protein
VGRFPTGNSARSEVKRQSALLNSTKDLEMYGLVTIKAGSHLMPPCS